MNGYHDLDLVCNGNRLASMPRGAGGEWDALRDLGRRERRRLIGHGFLSAKGLAPDVLAEYLGSWFGRDFTADEAVEFYLDNARRAVAERRRTRHSRIYERRNTRAQRAGYRSLWHYRREVLGQRSRSRR